MSANITFSDFARIIGETFDCSADSIKPDTPCDDIQGWDSLGHSVLLSRLDKRLNLALAEADAAPVETVGELFERLTQNQRTVLA